MNPRVGLDDVETLPGLELLLGRPTHSKLLYRLRYPRSTTMAEELEKLNQLMSGMR
jgi:hypothetical protein